MDKDRQIRAKIAREREVAALRDGRKFRASTIPNKKREAARTACRGKVTP
jgi:hypothetical protein